MDVDRYLARIGATRTDTLATIVDRHLAAVPFENLAIHLGETISLDPADLYDKIVERRRGGFCHELNGGLAWLVGELGYDVQLLGARVVGKGGVLSQPLSHSALRVTDGDAGPWLVDVGFGRCGVGPVALDPPDSDVVRPAPDGDVEVLEDGAPLYRVEPRPRAVSDFVPTCFWQANSPDSWFTHRPICALPQGRGWMSLDDRRLLWTGADGTQKEEQLTPGETLAAYRDHFGIELDRLPVALHPPAA